MTNKINDNVAMMILENAERVKTLNTNAYLQIGFEIESGDELCKIHVIYWKAIDSYSLMTEHKTKDTSCFKEFTAIEIVDVLGKIFSDDGVDLYRLMTS